MSHTACFIWYDSFLRTHLSTLDSPFFTFVQIKSTYSLLYRLFPHLKGVSKCCSLECSVNQSNRDWSNRTNQRASFEASIWKPALPIKLRIVFHSLISFFMFNSMPDSAGLHASECKILHILLGCTPTCATLSLHFWWTVPVRYYQVK